MGGALGIKDSNDLSLTRIQFTNNSNPSGNGGALYGEKCERVKIRLGDSEIRKNTGGDGGAFYFEDSTGLEIDGGQFIDNEAINGGGTLSFYSTTTVKLTNATIKNSKATAAKAVGGGIWFRKPGGEIRLDNVTISNSTATNAGALYIEDTAGAGTNVIIANSTFANNSSPGNGGAMVAKEISYPITINKTLFKQNSTQNYGGALALDGRYDDKARFIIGVDTRFDENSATLNYGGGAMYVTFNNTKAKTPLPDPMDRQLVFLNTYGDMKISQNKTGIGLKGEILRVTNAANILGNPTTVPKVAEENKGPPIFLAPIGLTPEPKVLNYFIAYDDTPGTTAPWNRWLITWGKANPLIYVW